MRRLSVRKPELYIGLPNFPLGGNQEVSLRESGTPFTLSRLVSMATLPTRLTDRDAQKIIAYNEAVETAAGGKAVSRARRRLPNAVRSLLYE